MSASGVPEEELRQDSKLEMAQKLFLLRSADAAAEEKAQIQSEVLAAIKQDDMLQLYLECCKEFGWQKDEALVSGMEERIAAEVAKLDDKVKDAEENLGESEVREAFLAKARYFIKIGDKEKSMKQVEETRGKTVATGQRMDLVFYTLRMGFFDLDFELIAKTLESAKSLFEEGGDWERKNRLKVYEGLFCMACRKFPRAAELFLDSISTFTTYELLPYNNFIFYTVLMSVVALDRVSLKEKVIDAPEILAVIDQIPDLSNFLNALYTCDYKKFFQAFSGLTTRIRRDRFLHPHFRYYMREIRVVAYAQFLEPYKSVTVAAMAKSFGVSPEFIDKELSLFIASGRLNCKIDKVGGILETMRPDSKNAQYQALIKQGDLLLNRVQKLSRVIDVA